MRSNLGRVQPWQRARGICAGSLSLCCMKVAGKHVRLEPQALIAPEPQIPKPAILQPLAIGKTLNPKPSTLNPQPETLNPKP